MGKYKIIFDPFAEIDISEGLDYYSAISQELALKFIDEVEQKLEVISNSPKAFQIRYSRYQTLPLTVFPFMIHYYTDEKSKVIYVLAVPHTSENPGSSWAD